MKPSLLTTDTVSATEGFLSLLVINTGSSRDSPGSGRRYTDCQESRLESEIVTGHTNICPLLTALLFDIVKL